MPNRETAWTCLWGLNRARLIVAGVVLATGALLWYLDTFPFPFAPFAVAAAGIGAACLLLPLGWARARKSGGCGSRAARPAAASPSIAA